MCNFSESIDISETPSLCLSRSSTFWRDLQNFLDHAHGFPWLAEQNNFRNLYSFRPVPSCLSHNFVTAPLLRKYRAVSLREQFCTSNRCSALQNREQSTIVAIPMFKPGPIPWSALIGANWLESFWFLGATRGVFSAFWSAFSPSVVFKKSRKIVVSYFERMVDFCRNAKRFNFAQYRHRIENVQVL